MVGYIIHTKTKKNQDRIKYVSIAEALKSRQDSEEDPGLTEGKTGVQVKEPGAQVLDVGLQHAGLQGTPQGSYVQLGRIQGLCPREINWPSNRASWIAITQQSREPSALNPDYDGPGPSSIWQKPLWRKAAAPEASTYFHKEFFKYNDKLSKMSTPGQGRERVFL